MGSFNLQFDPSFIEETVFLYAKACAYTEKALIDDFHQAREALYTKECPGEERDKDFQLLWADYFKKMGLRKTLENILMEFPLLSGPRIFIFIKRAWNKKQEDVELFARGEEDQKRVCIGLQAARMLDKPFLETFLRHELTHISDMLDSDFQYDPRISLGGKTELEDNLIRDRFHLLWDIYINLRLVRKGFPMNSSLDQQRGIFERLFSRWDGQKRESVFEQITTNENYTHENLLKLACCSRINNLPVLKETPRA